jgi:hypothetical protein
MPVEYSFFRADGASLAAVEAAEEARKEWHMLRKKLKDRFGADEVWGGFDAGTDRYSIEGFYFRPDRKTPEGWEIEEQMDYEGKEVESRQGMPKSGSPDDFYLKSMSGLMERAARTMTLEGAFGIPAMPMKELPAGEYHGEFVKSQSLKTPEGKPVGRLRDRVTMCFGSNGAGRSSDLMDSMELDGAIYIRVPNKPGTEEPQFVPPDAVPVAYERMLELDAKEYDNRYGRPRYGGPIC